ncbi:MAG: gamma-glutamylcyclotransferase [Actinomycetota bacterium]
MARPGGLYAAYGSNMDPEQMLTRCPHSPFAGIGWVHGWRLTFAGETAEWEGPVATIVPDLTSQVFVALYDLAPHDYDELDRWEAADTGLSEKISVRVSTVDSNEVAWAYVLDDYEGGLPTARYLAMIADAAECAGAPDEYVAELRLRPCRSD